MKTRRGLLAGLLMSWAALPAPASAAQGEPVVVFAAASLTDALSAIARQGGFGDIRFSFAASSTLARQIEQGAGAQIFISADEPWMEAVQKAGRIEADTRRVLAGNRLVLVAPGASGTAPPTQTPQAVRARLDAALAQPGARIATGDPAHVPVGRYARAALSALGRWDAVAPRLARAENVRSALALVERGEAPLGIVYATDASLSGKVHVVARFPASSHPPITYPAALLRGAGAPARRFYAHLFTPTAQALLRDAGFAPAPHR